MSTKGFSHFKPWYLVVMCQPRCLAFTGSRCPSENMNYFERVSFERLLETNCCRKGHWREETTLFQWPF